MQQSCVQGIVKRSSDVRYKFANTLCLARGKCCTIATVCVCTLSLQLGILSVIQKSLLDPFGHANYHHSQVPMCSSPRDHILLLETSAHMLCLACKKKSPIFACTKIYPASFLSCKKRRQICGHANNKHSHVFACLCSARAHIFVAILSTRQIAITSFFAGNKNILRTFLSCKNHC